MEMSHQEKKFGAGGEDSAQHSWQPPSPGHKGFALSDCTGKGELAGRPGAVSIPTSPSSQSPGIHSHGSTLRKTGAGRVPVAVGWDQSWETGPCGPWALPGCGAEPGWGCLQARARFWCGGRRDWPEGTSGCEWTPGVLARPLF